MTLKKEYRFVKYSREDFYDLMSSIKSQVKETGIEIVAVCNKRWRNYICPLRELTKETVNGDILAPVTVDGVSYPEPTLFLDFDKLDFIATLDLNSGEIFNENLGGYEAVTYELEEKLNKAFQEQYKTITIEAKGYSENAWDVYGIVYKGERSEKLENILKNLENSMRTEYTCLILEERTVDIANNLQSAWERVDNSSWTLTEYFNIEEAKKELADNNPVIKGLDISPIERYKYDF